MTSSTENSAVDADPYKFEFRADDTALLVIDIQRDFVEPGGFGDHLGNDVSKLQGAIEPTRGVLEAAREAGMTVVFTREGHEPNLGWISGRR
jgi:nicotinamidase-related amidase